MLKGGFSMLSSLRLTLCAAALLAALAPGTARPAQLIDPIPEKIQQAKNFSVTLETVATALVAPNWGTAAPGHPNRLFVVDQTGQLWAIDLTTKTKSVFLDVSSLLVSNLGNVIPGLDFDERGFLGVAFHPNYATNGLFYTFTTENKGNEAGIPADFSTLPSATPPDSQSVIREWQVPNPTDPASVPDPDPANSRELLRVDKPQFNHNGGAINFGPDGMLYIATGDGGAADDQGDGHVAIGNGQDPTSPNALGKILRINPDPSSPSGTLSANGQYRIPPDNPFSGRSGYVTEIFAYGFRNPFRFSFDSDTGDLYAADVGQNDLEEVDVVFSGGNYGWPLKEGSFCFNDNGSDPGFVTDEPACGPLGLIDPSAEYDHDNRVGSPPPPEGIAVIGGFVYRGNGIPSLRGHYVFGDFTRSFVSPQGRLFLLAGKDLVKKGQANASEIHEFTLKGQDTLGLFVLGFGQDASGELYVLANSTGVPADTTGVVLKIVP
jgi:glucose/arabinose dehydrogenase